MVFLKRLTYWAFEFCDVHRRVGYATRGTRKNTFTSCRLLGISIPNTAGENYFEVLLLSHTAFGACILEVVWVNIGVDEARLKMPNKVQVRGGDGCWTHQHEIHVGVFVLLYALFCSIEHACPCLTALRYNHVIVMSRSVRMHTAVRPRYTTGASVGRAACSGCATAVGISSTTTGRTAKCL